MNVDIFACMNFREFDKTGNFARIYIRILGIIASMYHIMGISMLLI